jgi:hypothetical protein
VKNPSRCGCGSHRVALKEWLARYPDFELSDPSAVTCSAGQVRGPRTPPVAIGRAGG